MRILHLTNKPADKTLIGKVPTEEQMGTVIDEDTLVYVDGVPALLYQILPESMVHGLRYIAENADMSMSKRVNGVPTRAAVFGTLPASPSRSTCFCRFSRPTHDQKEMLPPLMDFNQHVDRMYRETFPEAYARDMAWVESKVNADWRWMPGPYQTVNFNTNFAIPYHFDKGNVPGSLSNVLILSKDITGGQLVCPTLGVSLSQRDRAWTLFNGEGLLHGVRPIKYLRGERSYRSSIVYYTLRAMAACGSRSEEISRTQTRLTERARRTNAERLDKVRKMNRGLLAKREPGT